jgi:hypothetical protein
MSKKSVFCIATSGVQANQIADHLKAESFSDHEITVGAAVDGIAAGLVGRGVPQMEADLYEGKVKEGNILISVQTEDVGDIARARDMFKQAGAQDIYTADEDSVPKDNPATERGPRPFEFSAA